MLPLGSTTTLEAGLGGRGDFAARAPPPVAVALVGVQVVLV